MSDIYGETHSEDSKFYRTIKTFVLRAGRMTATQKKDYEELS